MKNTEFCHLHIHNEYSHLDGFGSAKDYAERAKEMGFEYLALTNHGNVDGCIEWQEECLKAGIKPIQGCEIYICDDMKGKGDKRHMTLLVKNESGWKTLLALLTAANLEGFYRRPRVDFEYLKTLDLSGLIILTACANSFIWMKEGYQFIIDAMKQTEAFFEIMPHDIEGQHKLNKELKYNMMGEVEYVATNDCHYPYPEDAKAQEVLLAIQRGAKWTDKDRWRFELDDLYLKSADEMLLAFRRQGDFDRGEIRQAMLNTVKIAEMCCDFRIEKKEISLPAPAISNIKDFKSLCSKSPRWINIEKYVKRFNEEYKIIREKNFESYFLIVKDLLDWCRQNDIAIGPGRGSVGGSLIAYLLGITEVDPIEHDLLFSRFINEDRIDWPDIDIDVEKKERHRAVEYLKNTYGENNTCGISTVSRLNGKGIIRDVGRVFAIPYNDIDAFAKSIIGTEKGAIEDALEEDIGQDFEKKYPDETDLMVHLEGTIKTRGQHAAGIVISADNLRDSGRCNLVVGKKDMPVCNWDMEYAEHQGLMKLDVLGLATLSVIKECCRLIDINRCKDHTEHNPLILSEISYDSQEVFDKINAGDTAGMFQISARPTTELCKEMKINSFADIVAALALVRPGPFKSGMTKDYIKRKHGEKWKPIHPIYEDITKDTYGLLVYQEQVMQVISRMAGLPYSESDKIRKVIGKKRDPSEFEPYKKKFMEGCKKQKTFTSKEAGDFWEGLLEWAQYGFGKAHSTGYAVITYQTAWLKTYFSQEFFCATLTYGEYNEKSRDTGKHKQSVIDEAIEAGFKIMPPKTGLSDSLRWVCKEGILYAPYCEIKGIGEKQAAKIIDSKSAAKTKLGGFFDLDDFQTVNLKGSKNDSILFDILAHEPDTMPSAEVLGRYFDFTFSNQFQSLIIKKVRVRVRQAKIFCEKCDLFSECKNPVPSSPGIYNVAIAGEAPGFDEDEEGEGFVGKAGQLLWNNMPYDRRNFYICNVCKCYPSKSKTPSVKQIKACMNQWLREELKKIDCQLALIFGNTGVMAFKEQDGGIMKLNGTTEYLPEFGLWACWCVHPSAVLRSGKEKMPAFKQGIGNFIKEFEKWKKK